MSGKIASLLARTSAVLAASLFCASARADFSFNPTGGASTPTYSISGLGFGPGNLLVPGSIPLTVGATFTSYFQTHLTSLSGPNAPASVPGLNSSFQITEVAAVTEQVTSIVATANGTVATFAVVPSANNRINIYYNNAVTFNDSSGNGFTDGQLIATLTPSSFTSSQFTNATAGGGKPRVAFNQTSSGTYSGVQADQGTGATGVNAGVNSYNSAFFVTPFLTSSLVNLNVSSFFDAVAPTLKINTPSGGTITPNIGAINGESGPDLLLQVSGFTQSFTVVPEPASIAMTLIGFAGAGIGSVVARRRKAQG
jgi:hypothetical protein